MTIESEDKQCPAVCSGKASTHGYVKGSRCTAEAGHSTYRNIVGHLFEEAAK